MTKFKFRNGVVSGMAGAVAALLMSALWAPAAYAQRYGGDINAVIGGVRAAIGIMATVAPGLVLAYYTWKMRPKDMYDAAWLAIAWCALAYVLR